MESFGQYGHIGHKLAFGVNSHGGVPLLILTSGGQPGDAERWRELGIAAYLTQPVDQLQLLAAVRSVVVRQAGASHITGFVDLLTSGNIRAESSCGRR